ncbi:MAG: YlxR family protein [Deltaproteobacteria bacterium]|nr:YlxR family protein [Deltaproteobacteria bacterium]
MRTCMGCGASAPQRDLLRVVRDEAAGLRADAARRLGGRGGYLHRKSDCLARFAQRKGALRSLRATVDRATRAALVATVALDAGE